MRLFGTSGIRRIADESLVQLALKVGLATGKIYRDVLVGTDTRTSGEALKRALSAGIIAAGARMTDAGIAPTPTIALDGSKHAASAVITASHNPPEYNGIKLLNPDGSAFSPAQQSEIEEIIENGSFSSAPWNEIYSSQFTDMAVENHIKCITDKFPSRLKLKVVIDCGGGAGSVITPILLREMGCEVVELYCEPTGFFPRIVEPNESSLTELKKLVRESHADLGIAHDGDADRMMAVDDKGRYIPGDKLLAIFAGELKSDTIITTVDASMTIDEMGLKVKRTPVGDNYVSEELKKGGDFGGEPSGAWIFRDISLCPDGIYAAAFLANIASRKRLSELADKISQYPIIRGSISLKGPVLDIEGHLLEMKPLSVDKSDGIKLNFSDGWLLVRPSGTEPRLRITAEARDKSRAQKLYNEGLRIIEKTTRVKEVA